MGSKGLLPTPNRQNLLTMINIAVFGQASKFTLGLQLVGWLVAYALGTETFYDVLGGLNYVWLAYSGRRPPPTSSTSRRLTVLTVLFLMSRGWLLLFLAWRAHSRKGDTRFDGVKDRFLVFGVYWTVQAFWVYLISMPLLVVQAMENDEEASSSSLTILDMMGLVGMAIGIAMEIWADVSKAIWVEKGRPGGFCTVGLWKYSRHPNYAGEMLQWWCAWLVAYGSVVTATTSMTNDTGLLDSPWFWWGLSSLSPLFTMHILLNVPGTGVAHAEGKNLKRYYESEHGEAYEAYRKSTSPVVPLVGYERLPLWFQRTFLFEWTLYEYRPNNSKKKE